MNLIVDFPASGRQRHRFTEYIESNLITQSPRPRSVRFDDNNSIRFIEPAVESEANIRWNTKQDFNAYRKALRADVKKVLKMLESKPHEVTDKDLIQCVGIETYLSESLLNRVLKKRERHILCILDEQWRQDQFNISDATMLSFVSERSSKWSVERASAIAKGYWELEYMH
eukprot:CAMPEP_0171432898 /NCGR_PEP_ID=MMETSP0881-20121228/8182_1 /TAXON_ID=67004 /ORGANISM="Thalassiosira weissflogii, Strain CCMP1336" /LENGTH=170 /DNA_ID=CAMNT_0011953403 /DNA_START=44 /DNA_END=556 /DNA_ORIENTATION=+